MSDHKELKTAIDRATAFGLVLGVAEGLILRLPTNERDRPLQIVEEAHSLRALCFGNDV